MRQRRETPVCGEVPTGDAAPVETPGRCGAADLKTGQAPDAQGIAQRMNKCLWTFRLTPECFQSMKMLREGRCGRNHHRNPAGQRLKRTQTKAFRP